MKTQKIKMMGVLLLALIFSVNAYTYAQGGAAGGKGNGYGRGNGQGFFCNNIPDITPEQETKINALRSAHLKDKLTYQNQLDEKFARLRTLQSSDNVDMKSINKTIDEISAIQSDILKGRAQHIQDVRNLLTDDQKVYFDSFRRGGGPGMGHGRGHGYGGGQGFERGQGHGRGTCRYW